ncbi:MAG: hypothetical protein ACR2OZ_13770 [Verrucomicrobiales bacterium]
MRIRRNPHEVAAWRLAGHTTFFEGRQGERAAPPIPAPEWRVHISAIASKTASMPSEIGSLEPS